MEIKTIIEKAELNLQRQIEWTAKLDTKISFVAGVAIAMLGVAANLDFASFKCSLYPIWVFLTFSLLGLTLLFIYLSQFPKTSSPNKSLNFFKTISDFSLKEFKDEFEKLNEKNYLEDVLHQTHINATIVKQKFHYLKLSLIFLALAVIPWTIIIYKTKNQENNFHKIEKFYDMGRNTYK